MKLAFIPKSYPGPARSRRDHLEELSGGGVKICLEKEMAN